MGPYERNESCRYLVTFCCFCSCFSFKNLDLEQHKYTMKAPWEGDVKITCTGRFLKPISVSVKINLQSAGNFDFLTMQLMDDSVKRGG